MDQSWMNAIRINYVRYNWVVMNIILKWKKLSRKL